MNHLLYLLSFSESFFFTGIQKTRKFRRNLTINTSNRHRQTETQHCERRALGLSSLFVPREPKKITTPLLFL